MDTQWSILALPGIMALILGWGIGGVVLFTRPAGRQNRWLAAHLVISATAMFFGTSARVLLVDPVDALAAIRTWLVLSVVGVVAYLGFLATIRVPMTAPLRRWPALRVTLYATVLLAAIVLALRSSLIAVDVFWSDAVGTWSFVRGPFFGATVALIGALALVYGLLVALSARRHANSPLTRRQANAYAAAFVYRDTMSLCVVLAALAFPAGTPGAVLPALVVLPLGEIGFALLLAYGVLRAQLFDIDLRLKWTLQKSTIAASFLAIFFIASETATQYLGDIAGSQYIGIAAAGALVFLLAPLQRVAERLSEAAMPDVEDTPRYRETRRREIYRTAVESAFADGVVTTKERALLATLADELGLGAREALAIETEALGGNEP